MFNCSIRAVIMSTVPFILKLPPTKNLRLGLTILRDVVFWMVVECDCEYCKLVLLTSDDVMIYESIYLDDDSDCSTGPVTNRRPDRCQAVTPHYLHLLPPSAFFRTSGGRTEDPSSAIQCRQFGRIATTGSEGCLGGEDGLARSTSVGGDIGGDRHAR